MAVAETDISWSKWRHFPSRGVSFAAFLTWARSGVFQGWSFSGNGIHSVSRRFWKGYRVIYHLSRHLKGIFKMPNACSVWLGELLHFTSTLTPRGWAPVEAPSRCRECSGNLVIYAFRFPAGRSGWCGQSFTTCLYLHLRNGSWTAKLDGTATGRALRKSCDEGERGLKQHIVSRGTFESGGEAVCWIRLLLLIFLWAIPSPGCHFPFLILSELCYIIPTFGKGFSSSNIWYYFTLGERGAQAGFAKLATSVL